MSHRAYRDTFGLTGLYYGSSSLHRLIGDQLSSSELIKDVVVSSEHSVYDLGSSEAHWNIIELSGYIFAR